MPIHHLSDRELVMALDRELPVSRRVAVDAHLLDCALCRARRDALDRSAMRATEAYRASLLETEFDASREELRRKLAAMTTRPLTRAERLESVLAGMPRWAMTGAALAVTVLIVALASRFEPREAFVAGRSPEKDSLPIASLTPGATWNVTADELCAPGDHEKRQVSAAVRGAVLRGYGMERVPADLYELDYLITPELGGAPAIQNLWPQRYTSRAWNAKVKDQLEDLLPRLVCAGSVSLQTAQRDIAADWIAAYRKYFNTDVPRQSLALMRSGFAFSFGNDEMARLSPSIYFLP